MLFYIFLLFLAVMCRATLSVDTLPSSFDIQERINSRFDSLFHTDDLGERKPYVCTICDEFILHNRNLCVLGADKLKKLSPQFSWENQLEPQLRIPAIETSFTFPYECYPDADLSWCQGLALSPRGVYFKKGWRQPRNNRGQFGFSCCSKCLDVLDNGTLPYHAIINKNYVGGAPACLTDLTEVELAFVSPVHTHGYCFSFGGGAQKNLKGTLTFMRVEERKTCTGLLQLERMGLNKHVIVLISGRMTKDQKKCNISVKFGQIS